MISQLFILAPRGDTVVKKEFRFDVPKNTPEVFFGAVRFWQNGEKAPAVFNERGVNYMHVKVRGVIFCLPDLVACIYAYTVLRCITHTNLPTPFTLTTHTNPRYTNPNPGFRFVRRGDDAAQWFAIVDFRVTPPNRASNQRLLRGFNGGQFA